MFHLIFQKFDVGFGFHSIFKNIMTVQIHIKRMIVVTKVLNTRITWNNMVIESVQPVTTLTNPLSSPDIFVWIDGKDN